MAAVAPEPAAAVLTTITTAATDDDCPSEPGPVDTEHPEFAAEPNRSSELGLCGQMEEHGDERHDRPEAGMEPESGALLDRTEPQLDRSGSYRSILPDPQHSAVVLHSLPDPPPGTEAGLSLAEPAEPTTNGADRVYMGLMQDNSEAERPEPGTGCCEGSAGKDTAVLGGPQPDSVLDLSPGSEVRVCLDHVIDDALVVSFRVGERAFSGVLMDVSRRFMATGDSYRTIAASFRVGVNTVSTIIPDVASAIWDCLVDEFMAVPGVDEWRSIAAEFEDVWNFPLCCGAVDGKHIKITAPPNSGSMYFNYKGTHSLVLLAVVDAMYRFRIIDVGGYGRTSDGGIFANSAFGQAVIDGTLDLPPDSCLPEADHRGPQPYVFVADEAFPLRRNVMRPFPGRGGLTREQRVFNYRLSRARLVVEDAFGIWSCQWRMFRRELNIAVRVVESCVKATCVLHNFMRASGQTPAPCGTEVYLEGVGRMGSNYPSRAANNTRDAFMAYFSTEGAVAWQHTE